jgi:ribosome recycling factor
VNKPSKEQREKVAKGASQVAEKAKADIRDIRRGGMDKLKKMEKRKEASKDDAFRLMKALESITEKSLEKATKLFKNKEAEIMS